VRTQSSWASGGYLAKLTTDAGKGAYIFFVVRQDARNSRFLFQVPVNTYQAYNYWGGRSLYPGALSPAVKVSLNRPYDDGDGAGLFLAYEYPMVRYLEREGYDVMYTTDLDVHLNPGSLRTHKAFLSVGHSEYWTMAQREAVQGARDAGVNIAFVGANTGYWQVRFEPSSSGTPNRTMVAYKQRYQQDPQYPSRLTTGLFRDPPVSLPENQLLGVMYGSNVVLSRPIVIDDATTWVTAGTGLRTGDQLPYLLGYEIDQMMAPAFTNPSVRRIAHSCGFVEPDGDDPSACGDVVVYTAASGATVFSVGTLQWPWGLDSYGAGRVPLHNHSYENEQAKRITRNVLARFQGLPLPP
jgi:hypothetical protein